MKPPAAAVQVALRRVMDRVRHVHVNDVDLEYMDEGTGVPVVFSHRDGSDIRYWEPQREANEVVLDFLARH